MSGVPLAGLLLAGGRSSRFGSDKALAVVDGERLIDRALACLRAVCDGPVLVASGDGTSRPGLGEDQVADLVQDAGPLSAIAAGMLELRRRGFEGAVAVLAVDHLRPSPEVLRHLAQRGVGAMQGPGEVACVLPEVDGQRQPLHAVWSTHIADDVAEAVLTGERGVLRWLAETQVCQVVTDEALTTIAGLELGFERDVDTPGDLPE